MNYYSELQPDPAGLPLWYDRVDFYLKEKENEYSDVAESFTDHSSHQQGRMG
jgi:hypothetical protein